MVSFSSYELSPCSVAESMLTVCVECSDAIVQLYMNAAVCTA